MKSLAIFLFTILVSVNTFANETPWIFFGEIKTKTKFSWEHDDLGSSLKKQKSVQTDIIFNVKRIIEDSWIETSLDLRSGKDDGFSIDRAVFGTRVFDDNVFLEVGRFSLGDVFQSKIQFNRTVNGFHSYYQAYLADDLLFSFRASSYLCDGMQGISNRIGHVIEYTCENIYELPLCVTACFHYYSHSILQFCGRYRTDVCDLYAGFLQNLQGSKVNMGYYVGLCHGSLKSKGDCSFDINYQYVSDNVVDMDDFQGIGTGIQGKFSFAMTNRISLQLKGSVSKEDRKRCIDAGIAYKW